MIPTLGCCSRQDESREGLEKAFSPLSRLLDKWIVTLEESYHDQLTQFKPQIEDSIREHIRSLQEKEEDTPIKVQNVQLSWDPDMLEYDEATGSIEHIAVPFEREPQTSLQSVCTSAAQLPVIICEQQNANGNFIPRFNDLPEYEDLYRHANSDDSHDALGSIPENRDFCQHANSDDSQDGIVAIAPQGKTDTDDNALGGEGQQPLSDRRLQSERTGDKVSFVDKVASVASTRKIKYGERTLQLQAARRARIDRSSMKSDVIEASQRLHSAKPSVMNSGHKSSSSSRKSLLRRGLSSVYGGVRGTHRMMKTTMGRNAYETNRGENFTGQVNNTYARRKTVSAEEAKKMQQRACLRHMVTGRNFRIASGALILVNGVFVGVRMHLSAKLEFDVAFGNAEKTEYDWQLWEILFIIFFCLELGIRIAGERSSFFRNRDWRWNWFDFIIVLLSVLELLVELVLKNIVEGPEVSNLPVLRVIRIARVLRLLKFINMIPFFRHLRVMITSVFDSLAALMPAIVLLLIIMYIFGMMILQGVISFVQSSGPDETAFEDQKALNEWWSGVPETMMTLIMCITNGMSWIEAIKPLKRLNLLYAFIFLSYVLFVQIGVLNIVTGIFVDTVHQMFKPEREDIVEREALKRKQHIDNMVELFLETDKDKSGCVSFEEFAEHLRDEKVQMFFESLSLDVSQATAIFDLMDSDGSGEVDIEEFVDGFLSLRGEAKSVDLWLLKRDHKRFIQDFESFSIATTTALKNLARVTGPAKPSLTARPSTAIGQSDAARLSLEK